MLGLNFLSLLAVVSIPALFSFQNRLIKRNNIKNELKMGIDVSGLTVGPIPQEV
jgi:hypothetical protein